MYDQNNPFAKIIRKELKAEIVYEDENLLAFHDIKPAASTHVLVIPKKPYSSYDDFISKAASEEIVYFFKKITEICTLLKLINGYRLVTNIGRDGNQTVFHFHVHILAGKRIDNL